MMLPQVNPYYFQQQMFQMPQIANYTQNVAQINGRLVDSIDNITANDVSMQGINVFPKNDLSEVYIKSWQPNGTIQTIRYSKIDDLNKLNLIDGKNIDQTQNVALRGDLDGKNGILERLDNIEKQLQEILAVSRPKKVGKNEPTNDN